MSSNQAETMATVTAEDIEKLFFTSDPMISALNDITLILQNLDPSITLLPIVIKDDNIISKYYWLDAIFRYHMGLGENPEIEYQSLLSSNSARALVLVEQYKNTTLLVQSFITLYELWLTKHTKTYSPLVQDFKIFYTMMLIQVEKSGEPKRAAAMSKICKSWDDLLQTYTKIDLLNIDDVKCWICNYIRSKVMM